MATWTDVRLLDQRPAIADLPTYWTTWEGRRWAACQAVVIAEDAPSWMWIEEDSPHFLWLDGQDAAPALNAVANAAPAVLGGIACSADDEDDGSRWVAVTAGAMTRWFNTYLLQTLIGGDLFLTEHNGIGLCAVRDRKDGRLLAVCAGCLCRVVS